MHVLRCARPRAAGRSQPRAYQVTEFVTIGLVPAIASSLQFEVEAIGGAVAAFAIGATIGAPVLTALAAAWPRRRLLLAAMAVFTLGNVVVALSTSLPMLLAARFGSRMSSLAKNLVAIAFALPEIRCASANHEKQIAQHSLPRPRCG